MAKTLTGPVSKDVHSGGKKFPLKEKNVPASSSGSGFTNSSENARKIIMGIKFTGSSQSPNVESGIKNPSR